jgi:starvation-inducible DNA-binding protein
MAKAATVLTPEPHELKLKTGLDDRYRETMARTLSEILSANYQLTIKSHIYHWNVVGPLFKPIHDLTEEHYETLFAASDVIAERIRALGHLAPVDLAMAKSFAPSAQSVDQLSGHRMVADLIESHESAVRQIREAASAAGEAGDIVTEDMLTARSGFHEKAIWMLSAIIAQ